MKRPLSPDEVAERLAQKSGIAKPANSRAKRGRANLKPIMTWHDPAVRQQLKLLGAETDKTEQKLMQEALNLLFAKYGKPQIA
jgi:hypothetical protein